MKGKQIWKNLSKTGVFPLKLNILVVFSFLFIALLSASALAALNVQLSDQGTGLKITSSGTLLNNGNLTVLIYDALSGGNVVYNETFTSAINNGSWNVMLGQGSTALPLEFGKQYYKDYTINGEDISFTLNDGSSVDRLEFFAPLGDINTSDIATDAITSAKIADSTIVDADISDTTNLTLGEKITREKRGLKSST